MRLQIVDILSYFPQVIHTFDGGRAHAKLASRTVEDRRAIGLGYRDIHGLNPYVSPMPVLRHIIAWLMVLTVVTTVCGTCVAAIPAVDSCCEVPCQQCACFDAAVPMQVPDAAAPVVMELRTAPAFVEDGSEGRTDVRILTTTATSASVRTGPANPPSLSMLSVFRI